MGYPGPAIAGVKLKTVVPELKGSKPTPVYLTNILHWYSNETGRHYLCKINSLPEYYFDVNQQEKMSKNFTFLDIKA
ncbi:hypothetical protein [Parafilimonas sp.]|uniref:hypothetical protein n=1 Tax=Parafilimonas sp. TaxID=1969739 RepID=UPI0039E24366